MKITILGCGTSTGVPVVGCPCNVCVSKDPRNFRTRASLLVEWKGRNFLVDTAPDLHMQALAMKLRRVDAVFYTHGHADHIFGLDELRVFNFIQGGVIPIYGRPETIEQIRRIFDYIWDPGAPLGGGKPMLETRVLDGKVEVFGLPVQPVEIWHGQQLITGYVFDRVGYLTDCSGLPEPSRALLQEKELLIVGALRHRPHPTHFHLQAALDLIAELKPRRALLTHLSHSFDYEQTGAELPPGVELAYDGQVIELEDRS
jgi:phosphoribosyl 1,2-cyclic phosphate phosphodiesterase